MNTDQALLLSLAAALSALGLVLLRVRRKRCYKSSEIDSAFVFDPPDAQTQRRFLYEVAGLIKLTTKLDTRVVYGVRDAGIDIEVYRGVRLIGIIGVVQQERASLVAPVRALAVYKRKRRVRTAYLVTDGAINDEARRYAKKVHVALIDGAALDRMRAHVQQRPGETSPPAPLEQDDIRWQPPPTKRKLFRGASRSGRGAWVDYY